MSAPARLLATVFGAGFFPVAPGTFASLIAVLVYKLLLSGLPLPAQAGILLFVSLAGVWAAGKTARLLGRKDPRPIVVDEVCGQWLSLIAVPAGWGFMAAGFFLFRVFDVFKPFPIRRLESLPDGWGIMADDLLAGVYAAALILIYVALR